MSPEEWARKIQSLLREVEAEGYRVDLDRYHDELVIYDTRLPYGERISLRIEW